MKKILLLCCLLPASVIQAVDIEPRIYRDAASLGMGGVGVSSIGYSFSAIANPANLGLMTDHDIAPFISLGASINPDMITLINEAKGIADNPTDFTSIDYEQLLNQAPSIGLNGPLSAGYMGKGFGIWTTSSMNATVAIAESQDNFLTRLGIDVNVNAVMAAGKEISEAPTGTDTLAIFRKHFEADFIAAGLDATEITAELQKLVDTPELLKELIPLARLSATAEITANIAYGYKIPFAAIDDVSGISFGATVRFSQRFKVMSEGDGPYGFSPIDQLPAQFGSLTDSVYQAGSISSDFGMSLRIQNWIFGVAVRDALSSGYQWKNMDGLSGGINDSKIPYSVDFGSSYRFLFKNNFIQEVSIYLEFEDTTDPYTSWGNKLRLGAEVKLFNFLDLRVGMYDTFITAGLGMGWKWMRLDFAYYRESYFDFFTSDQFYINMTVGLDNSPSRKERSIEKQREQDRIQSQALSLINNSLEGL